MEIMQEQQDLNEKLGRLSSFIDDSYSFVDLPRREQSLLRQQRIAMMEYDRILRERLEE